MLDPLHTYSLQHSVANNGYLLFLACSAAGQLTLGAAVYQLGVTEIKIIFSSVTIGYSRFSGNKFGLIGS